MTLFDLAKLEAEIDRTNREIEQEGFWDDPDKAQKVMKEKKSMETTVDAYRRLENTLEDIKELIELAEADNDPSMDKEISKMFEDFEEKLESMRISTLLTGKYDKCGAIVSIHAGTGGVDAMDWASMLLRLYTRWCEKKGYKVTLTDYQNDTEAGIKSATIMVDGENAYGYLKNEKGVHRLVRISPFNTAGKRQTSFAQLEVVPQVEEDLSVEIDPEDLKIDTFRSSGAGGQHVNKTESAIRITHIPTGVIVACQNERSQHQNREVAMKMLKSKLVKIKEREHLKRIEDIKGEQQQIGWGSQIRSYVFMPYTLVKDHRTNCESGNINAVMDGDLDPFINAYLKAASQGEI